MNRRSLIQATIAGGLTAVIPSAAKASSQDEDPLFPQGGIHLEVVRNRLRSPIGRSILMLHMVPVAEIALTGYMAQERGCPCALPVYEKMLAVHSRCGGTEHYNRHNTMVMVGRLKEAIDDPHLARLRTQYPLGSEFVERHEFYINFVKAVRI